MQKGESLAKLLALLQAGEVSERIRILSFDRSVKRERAALWMDFVRRI